MLYEYEKEKNMYLCQNKINNEMIRISFFEFLKNVENNFGSCDKKMFEEIC